MTIYNPLTLRGAGTCTTNGAPSGNGTYLNYTGSGTAIIIGDNSATDKEGYKLRDFEVIGTSSATNGIQVGAGHASSKWFLKGSIKRVTVRGFTKAGAAGFLLDSVISGVFEQCYAQANAIGFSITGTTTNSTFINCYARTNTGIGWYLHDIVESSFHDCLSESNGAEGLKIWTSGVGSLVFNNFYSTDNNSSSGTAPVVIGGDSNAPAYITFVGGYFQTTMTPNYQFNLGYAQYVEWINPTVTSYNASWMTVTANTVGCKYRTNAYPNLDMTDIAGWTATRLNMKCENHSWTPTITDQHSHTATTSVAKGVYSLDGNRVTVTGQVALSDKSSLTGTDALLIQLPSALGNVAPSPSPNMPGVVQVAYVGTDNSGLSMQANPSTTTAYIMQNSVSSITDGLVLLVSDCVNTSQFYFSVSYLVQ